MLEYEWGNPSTIMFTTGEETSQEAVDQNRHLFDPYATQTFNETTALLNPNAAHFSTAHNPHHLFHHDPQSSNHAHLNSLYDPRSAAAAAAAYGTSSYGHPNPHHHHHHNQTSMLSLESAGPTGYMVVPKTEPALVGALDFTNSGRIGLNLGGRTYFSSSEDDFVSRLYRRSRVAEPGSLNSPRCQAEGCNADLTNAKHYHRRHKVCEFHSKAATVIAAGLTQRFCQQCSRYYYYFHIFRKCKMTRMPSGNGRANDWGLWLYFKGGDPEGICVRKNLCFPISLHRFKYFKVRFVFAFYSK